MRNLLTSVVLGLGVLIAAGCSDEGVVTPAAEGGETTLTIEDLIVGPATRSGCPSAATFEFYVDELVEEWTTAVTSQRSQPNGSYCTFTASGQLDIKGTSAFVLVNDIHVGRTGCYPTLNPVSLLTFTADVFQPSIAALTNGNAYNCSTTYGSGSVTWEFDLVDPYGQEHNVLLFVSL